MIDLLKTVLHFPLVSIGLPIYSRPNLLKRALISLTNQSYANLEIVISDDHSPDDLVRSVARSYIESDPRIHYYFQDKNLGHFENHRFVFKVARGDFFFWASEDDEWHENFVEVGVQTLIENSNFDAWCCTLRNIDVAGKVLREYPGFSRFSSSRNKVRDIIAYLVEPEVMGKANIFHGIFRRNALEKTVQDYFFGDVWGSDYCFNLAFISRFNLTKI